ncbi:MAG: hypothetical protein IJN54_12925 [Lachnospiraceae bacterium]|nr:hypothetical protein [Lachnospiraceae bacterium]
MSNKYKKIIGIWAVSFLSILCLFLLLNGIYTEANQYTKDEYEIGLFINENNQYISKQVELGYEVKLYDKNNKEIYSVVYPKEPWIKEVTENILEIGISTGSPSRHVFYFNKETSKISDVYFNSILLDNKYVAYMGNSEELIIMDIFNEGILCKKVTRDFSKTANPSSAIINIEIEDGENILLEYLLGVDYMEVSETINLIDD